MFHSGYQELSSYFEDASFPVILLKTDLTVEYMNSEAENCFGKYFRKPKWEKYCFEPEVELQIKYSLAKGESVVISPPQIKDFSMMLFQPIFGSNGMPDLVRLNIEVFRDVCRQREVQSIDQSLFEYTNNELLESLHAMEMALRLIKKEDDQEINKPYFDIFENGINTVKSKALNYEYIYELMRKHDIATDTIFNPRIDIKRIMDDMPDVEYTDLLGDTSIIINNRTALEISFKAIISYVQILSGTMEVKVKAYESDPHFVFVFKAEKNPDAFFDMIEAMNQKTVMDIIKLRTEENGGNMIVANTEDSVKILYSIRKHLRSEYSMVFNQNQIQI